MKKWSIVLLFCCVVLAGGLLVGCNSQESNTENKQRTSDTESQEISIMLNLHVPEVPDKRLEELIEEETNTELDIKWVPDNNYAESLNTSIATNNLPDVFLLKDVTLEQQKDAIRDDQYWEIGPYLMIIQTYLN